MKIADERDYEIGIDCPPGEPRPDALFPFVIRDSGLCVSDFHLKSKLFGAWMWGLNSGEENERLYIEARPEIWRRLQGLYEINIIRGAVLSDVDSD